MRFNHSGRRSIHWAAAIAFILLLPIAGQVFAQGGPGTSAVVFLKIEPDSRAAGMGNAGVALADNASAIFWNPAGLAFQRGTEAAITHSEWLPEFDAGLYYEYLVAKHHLPGWGTLGAHLTYLNLGRHEGRDEQNNPTGSFSSYDMALGLSFGFNVTSRFALGTSLRFIYSNLAPNQIVGAQKTKAGVSTAFDFAGLYKVKPFNLGSTLGTVSLGFNLANMGPKIQYSDNAQADPIPTNLRFGLAFKLDFDEYNSLTWVADFNKDLIHSSGSDSTGVNYDSFYKAVFSSWSSFKVPNGPVGDENTTYDTVTVLEQLTIGTGFEYWYDQLLALRGGYFYENPNNGNRKFLTLGAGVRYNIIGVDFSYIYALEEDSPLSNTMRFSLLLDFNR